MRTKLEQIESARKKILTLQAEEDRTFQELVVDEIGDNEWAWDYCVNCPDQDSDYAIKCRQEIESAIHASKE